MKECVVTTFDANVALYEENIRKADSQRMLAGWQFLPFCRQKVPCAHNPDLRFRRPPTDANEWRSRKRWPTRSRR